MVGYTTRELRSIYNSGYFGTKKLTEKQKARLAKEIAKRTIKNRKRKKQSSNSNSLTFGGMKIW